MNYNAQNPLPSMITGHSDWGGGGGGFWRIYPSNLPTAVPWEGRLLPVPSGQARPYETKPLRSASFTPLPRVRSRRGGRAEPSLRLLGGARGPLGRSCCLPRRQLLLGRGRKKAGKARCAPGAVASAANEGRGGSRPPGLFLACNSAWGGCAAAYPRKRRRTCG